ncbi:hypothetical protein BGZ79_011080 [Entomortierella chlamydospora]|nr:hypothetical protein BGZ79_011080 [Entomortierella chlamydospora]
MRTGSSVLFGNVSITCWSAVFIQVYSTARDSLVGVFVTIITLATVFLWLEGGIWDPVGDNSNSDDWVFHTMMITYFFFTTILLLNVLIALINVAFSTGNETWLSVWTENRLRHVESAESLTYNIPGFRDARDWFPKEIYYSATLQEVKDYHEKYFKKDVQDSVKSNVLTQQLFGQASPSKKITAASVAKNYSASWPS